MAGLLDYYITSVARDDVSEVLEGFRVAWIGVLIQGLGDLNRQLTLGHALQKHFLGAYLAHGVVDSLRIHIHTTNPRTLLAVFDDRY